MKKSSNRWVQWVLLGVVLVGCAVAGSCIKPEDAADGADLGQAAAACVFDNPESTFDRCTFGS